MPRLDDCHPQVVRALEKDGWIVADAPERLRQGKRAVFIDARATRRINGRILQILLLEIKCFPDRDSTTEELYIAIGQYIIYRAMLAYREIDIPLYLAIPDDVDRDIFDVVVQRAVSDSKIRLVIVNLATETIVEWRE